MVCVSEECCMSTEEEMQKLGADLYLGYSDYPRRLGLDSFLPTGQTVMWRREAGPLSREGRSLCGQTEQSHPEGWVLRQQKRKTHLFSLLRTRWNVMVWSQTSQGGGISERKEPTKVISGKGTKQKRTPSLASNPPVVSDCGWTCLRRVGNSESNRPHELKPCEVVDLPTRFSEPPLDQLR